MTTVAAAVAHEKDLISRRTLMLGVGAAATAGVAGLMTPRHYEPGVNQIHLEAAIPTSVGPWQARPAGAFILPEDGAAASAYDQIVTRTFVAASGPDIMLLVAHGAAQSGLMRVHRPEVCYASAGFQIQGLHSLDLAVAPGQTIAAQTFIGQREDRVENVLYWTRIGGFFPRNVMDQRIDMLKLGLEGLIPDGVLVRMSALGEGETAPALTLFAAEMVRGSGPAERALLLGPQDSRSLT
jgi:EpsI family protein